jgi:hypothetical protein
MFREFEEPDWVQDWWERFGLHPLGVNPQVSETLSMFELFHRTLRTVHDLYSEEEFKEIIITEKHPWVLRTKFMLEDDGPDTDPILLQQVYTMHWDPYLFNHYQDCPPD